jgi:hypothetical protein
VVWFDAAGGVEHGDEWDARIRRQIKACLLFIPVISAHTQARPEGFFRIEWDLAAERARGIASGIPFLLPVVLDDIAEPEALVPERFRTVQWTRLRDGPSPPEVVQRFKQIWMQRISGATPVNTAARTDSTGEAGRIQLTARTNALLADGFLTTQRGAIDVKGKGVMQTFWLERERSTP